MDESFVRTWRLYLAGSIAAFNVGELQLFQVVFSRDRNNQVPWSRLHLYTDSIPHEQSTLAAKETAGA